jgi:hypothetical protein
MDRRFFMQMLGLGGLGALAAPSLSSTRLFGTSDDKLYVPGENNFYSGHWVVKAKPLTQDVSGVVGPSRVVKRLTPLRTPRKVWDRRNGEITVSVPYDGTVADAHRAYYLGSRELREKFSQQSLQFLNESDARKDPFNVYALVTIAHSEIYATHSFREDGENYIDICLDCEQYVLRNGYFEDMQTFEKYSEFGEYPISVPRDIDFGVMLKLDSEIATSGKKAPPDRVSQILGRIFS